MKEKESSPIVKLNWMGRAAGVDPFAALAGEDEGALVSIATCAARSDDQLQGALSQLVVRTALLARRLASGAARVLFIWDPVYTQLTILFTDETMYIDGPLVTKCQFPLLDEGHSELSRVNEEKWELETVRVSRLVREILAFELSRVKLPPGMGAYFSDHDRASFAPEEFESFSLIS